MKRILYATSVLLSSLLPCVVTAQRPALTMSEAASRAIATHPSMEAADAAVARSRSGVREAQSGLYPGVSVDGNAIRFGKPMVVAPLHGFDLRQPPEFDKTLMQGGLSAAYTVFDNGARNARIDRAQALESAAESGADASRLALMSQTVFAYTTVVAARDVLLANTVRMDAVRRERQRAALLFREGKAAQIAVLRADASLASARADSLQAEAERDASERALARQVGIGADGIRTTTLSPVRNPSSGPDASNDRDAVLANARARSPELQRLSYQLEASRRSIVEARSGRLPKVQVGARVSEYASSNGFASTEWQGGVQLSYAVFTGGSSSAASQRADAEVRAAAADLALMDIRISDAVDRAISAAQSAHARASSLDEAATQQQEVVRIEKLSLDTGTGVQTDYLNAEAELFRFRAAATQARAAEMQARAELARLAGTLSPQWITTNLERIP